MKLCCILASDVNVREDEDEDEDNNEVEDVAIYRVTFKTKSGNAKFSGNDTNFTIKSTDGNDDAIKGTFSKWNKNSGEKIKLVCH